MDETIFRELWEQDLTQNEIAAHFGTSRSKVQRFAKARGLRKARTGPKSGARHPCWKGGLVICKGYEYRYMPEHPNATKLGYVLVHRLVMEAKLGRYLDPNEVVHHVDGDRRNNSPDNLAVFQTNAEHLRHELTGRVPQWTPDGKRRIDEAWQRAVATLKRKARDAQPVPQTTDHRS